MSEPVDQPDLADLLASAIARADPSLAARLDDDPRAHLDLVLLTSRAHEETGRLLHASVSSARAAGWSWVSIGELLGMSRQAAQQRFGHRPGAAEDTDERRQLIGLNAFNEMETLNAWGRHGWHSVSFGPLFHDVERSEVQWEHRRVVVGTGHARELEAEGWERIGTMWFPWVYLKRRLDLPAEPGEPA